MRTIESCLGSLVPILDDPSFEIVVSDASSSDGSEKILQRFADEGKIKLVRTEKCSRGKGRQHALEQSSGKFVVSNIDFDDIVEVTSLQNILDVYQRRFSDRLLSVFNTRYGHSNLIIADAMLLRRLGGWRDVNVHEDWDMQARAAQIGKFAWVRTQWLSRTDTHVGRVRPYFEWYWTAMKVGKQYQNVRIRGKLYALPFRIYAAFLRSIPTTERDFKRTFSKFDQRYFARI